MNHDLPVKLRQGKCRKWNDYVLMPQKTTSIPVLQISLKLVYGIRVRQARVNAHGVIIYGQNKILSNLFELLFLISTMCTSLLGNIICVQGE